MRRSLLTLLLFTILNKSFSQAPVISSFSPSSGNIGATITINGNNFNTTAANNAVLFGGVKAEVVTATARALTVKVPAGAVYKPLAVTNTSNKLTGYSSAAFALTNPLIVDSKSEIDFDPEFYLDNGGQFSTNFENAALADIDRDGKLDILVTNRDIGLYIYQNKSDGGLLKESFKKTIIPVSQASFVSIDDINGDGRPDIILASTSQNNITILLNNATSAAITDASFTKIGIKTATAPAQIYTGDIDGDGKPDILTSNSVDAITLYRNTSVNGIINSSSFAERINVPVPSAVDYDKKVVVSLGDLNNDGKPDIVVSRLGVKTVIYHNVASSGSINSKSFIPVTEVQSAGGYMPITQHIADLNSDGKPEIVFTYSNFGNYSFSIFQNNTPNGSNAIAFGTAVTIPYDSYTESMVITDMNGDGKPELICKSYTTINSKKVMYIFRNATTPGGNISVTSFSRQSFSIRPPHAVLAVGDLDGDGWSDWVSAGRDMSIIRNNPLAPPIVEKVKSETSFDVGTLIAIEGENFGLTPKDNEVHFGTIKATIATAAKKRIVVNVPAGAGYEQISVFNKAKNLAGYSKYGAGTTFYSKFDIKPADFAPKFDIANSEKPSDTAIGDIDGDGKPDMVVTNTTGNNVFVYRNTSSDGKLTTASFSARVSFITGTEPSSVIIRDIDNDNKADIIVTNSADNTVSVLRNKSVSGSINSSSFAQKVDFATGDKPVNATVADIDGDGWQDILTANINANTFSVLHNTTIKGVISAASFAAKVDFVTGTSPCAILTAQINNDVKPEVVIANYDDGNISVFENKSVPGFIKASSFGTNTNYPAGTNPTDLVLGSSPGYGMFIAIANKGSNNVTVYANTNSSAIALGDKKNFTTGKSPVAIKLADIDGDGLPDIITANQADNTISVLRNLSISDVRDFRPKVDIATGATPVSVSINDLDNDVKPDIIVANSNDNSISVLHNYSADIAPSITSFTPATGVAGDDITITGANFNTEPGKNAVYFGAVKATVTQASATQLVVKVPVGATYAPLSVANTGTNLIAQTSNPFMPTFVNRNSITSQGFDDRFDFKITFPNNTATLAGDVDNDGKPDLIWMNTSSGWGTPVSYIYKNIAEKGVLNKDSFVKRDSLFLYNSAILVDINADGKLDVAEFVNLFAYRLNISEPGNTTSPVFTERRELSVYGNKMVDLNNDGKLDIVNCGTEGVIVYRNISTTADKVQFANPLIIPADRYYGYNITVTDIDNDGKKDLIIFNPTSTTISVFRNISENGSTPAFAPKVDLNIGTLPLGMTFADLNLDGKMDIITTNPSTKSISVLRNVYTTGSSTVFAPKQDIFIPVNGIVGANHVIRVSVSDMNGDNRPDIIASLYNEYNTYGNDTVNSVTLFTNRNTGNNILATFFVKENNLNAGTIRAAATAADFDGDGRPDLITSSNIGFSILRNNPFRAPILTGLAPAYGEVGSKVIIKGDYFNANAANNIVSFGAVKATVTDAAFNTLTVKVPVGVTHMPVTVLNTETQLSAASPKPFGTTFLADKYFTPATFTRKLSAPTGSKPGISAISDLDSDGKPDIAVVNTASNTVSIFRNTYTGGTRTDFKTGANPSFVSIADLDNDGKPDMVVANKGSNTVSVYRNISSGAGISASSFAAKIDLITGAKPVAVAIADIDRDGRPDILVANSGEYAFSVFRNLTEQPGNMSSASFKAKVDFTVGGNPVAITVADIDGDNVFDVLTANANTKNISVLRNKAFKGVINSISFAAKVDFTGSGNMVSIATGDIDGDGRQDILAATNGENTLNYYRSNAVKDTITSYTFSGYNVYGLNASPSYVAVSDLNGDGKPDVIVVNSANDSLSVYPNYNNNLGVSVKYFAGKAPASAVLGDVTGDGKPDMVVVNSGSNTISVLGNNLVNSAPVITSISPASGMPGTIVTIGGKNFDESPQNNIVYFGATRAQVINGFETLLYVSVPHGATYQPVSVLNTYKGLTGYSSEPFVTTYNSKASAIDPKVDIATGKNPVSVLFGDVTGDGKPDMLVSNAADNSINVYTNNITVKGPFNLQSFAASVKIKTGSAPASIALADFNADGKTDMVAANYNGGSISVMTGSGQSSLFLSKVDYTVGKNPSSVVVSDINGDGKPDILVSNSGGSTVSVLRNTTVNGVITFTTATIQTGANPSSVAVADINNDGKPDVVTANFSGNSVSVIQNRTVTASQTLSFAGKVDVPAGKNPQSVAVGDVNYDGKPDIITANKGGNSVSVIGNKYTSGNIAAGSFSTKKDFTAGNAPLFVVLNDFTGDGKVDILVANSASKSISILGNASAAGTIAFAAKTDVAAGNGPQSLTAGDLDADGKPDIAVANFTGNNVSLIHNAATAFPPPVISSFSPKLGVAGQLITINGNNFNTDVDKNLVVFGAVSAKPVSATANKITVRVPAGATQQPFSVLNLSTGLAGKASAPYVITHNGKSVLSQVDFIRLPSVPRSGGYTYSKVADIDGDGKSDIVALDYSNVYIQHNISDSSGVKFMELYFSTGYFGTQSLSIEDMDGDGKPDLVFLNSNRTILSIIRNKSVPGGITQFSFDQRVDFQLPGETTELSVGDIDGDGKPDIAISYRINYNTETLAIYRNVAIPGAFHTGSLEARIDNMLGSINTILIGDVNNDNKPDAAGLVRDGIKTNLNIYKNVVAGNITSNSFSLAGVQSPVNPTRFKLADIDGDGKADIITLNNNKTLSVLRNISTGGGFSFEAAVEVPLAEFWVSVAIGDVNGDGKADLVFSGYNNSGIGFMLNKNLSGSVKASLFLPVVRYNSVNTNGSDVNIADIDNDGRPDIITDAAAILKNTPDHNLPAITSVNPLSGKAGTMVTITGNNFNSSASGNIVYFGSVPAKILTAGNNVLTVEVPAGATYRPVSVQNLSKGLTATYSRYFNLTFNSASQSFKPRVTFATNGNPAAMCIYDVDVDGKPDMLTASPNTGKISVYRNTAVSGSITSASFAASVDINNEGGAVSIAAGDLDGDGKPELVVANNGSKKIAVYSNSSSPGSINSTSFTLKFNLALNYSPLDIKLADVDGDGTFDILVTYATGTYYSTSVYFNRPTGVFTANSFVGTGITSYNPRPAISVADVDDDNKPDFVTVGYSDRISVTKNTFEIGSIYTQFTGNSFLAGTEPQSICTGDLDGDNKPELIVANKASNTISILRNTITNAIDYYAFAEKVDIATLTNPKRVSMGDVNGDGKPDLVVTFFDSDKAMVYYNKTTTGNITSASFSQQKELDAGSDADYISIGDIDGDGCADMAFTNYNSNTISIIQNLNSAGLNTASMLQNIITDETVSGLNIYPNPSVTYSNVQYTLPSQSDVEVKVFDKNGRQVRYYKNKAQTAGTSKTVVDTQGLNEGIYIITVKAANYNGTGKLVKQ